MWCCCSSADGAAPHESVNKQADHCVEQHNFLGKWLMPALQQLKNGITDCESFQTGPDSSDSVSQSVRMPTC